MLAAITVGWYVIGVDRGGAVTSYFYLKGMPGVFYIKKKWGRW